MRLGSSRSFAKTCGWRCRRTRPGTRDARAVAAFLAGVAFAPGSEAHRFLPTRANRQPAFGVYRGEGADARPFAINVVGIESGVVVDMHFFKYPELFPAFGLPDTLQ
jgi:RNA polymerase sigma-70 factor, ECF subfamily